MADVRYEDEYADWELELVAKGVLSPPPVRPHKQRSEYTVADEVRHVQASRRGEIIDPPLTEGEKAIRREKAIAAGEYDHNADLSPHEMSVDQHVQRLRARGRF